jgi:hypothetical protein
MASVEYKSTKQNLESIRQQGIINVTGIVSDGCNQIPRLIRDLKMEHQYSIDHYTCCVHSNRTTQKHVKHLKFVSKYKNNDTFQRQLSVVISQRITRELKRVNKLYFNNSNFNNCNFIEKAHLAIINVPQCVSGDHSQCKNSSLICKGGRHLDCTKFLPNGQYVKLSIWDKNTLCTKLSEDFSKSNLAKLAPMFNTNACESLNHRAFTYAPKFTVWSRNFSGLCMSACLSNSLGTGKSTLTVSNKLGVPYSKIIGPMVNFMKSTDHEKEYARKYKQSNLYKFKRFVSRFKKIIPKQLQVHTIKDHPYTIQF